MLRLTVELFRQYCTSSVGGYQFVNQEILYSLSVLFTFLCSQYVM
jgi:hypothetical protein